MTYIHIIIYLILNVNIGMILSSNRLIVVTFLILYNIMRSYTHKNNVITQICNYNTYRTVNLRK